MAPALCPVHAELSSRIRPISFGPFTDCTNQLGSAQPQATQPQATQHQHMDRLRVHKFQPVAASGKESEFAFRTRAKARDCLVCSTAAIPDISSSQRHGLACSASGAVAALTSLTEEEFWQARADLLDTAETVRHKSRLQICPIGAVCPGGMPQAALLKTQTSF